MLFSRNTISDGLKFWITENFIWVRQQSGQHYAPPPDHLILPTKAFFQAARGNDEETASAVLQDIAKILGLTDHNFTLQPLPSLPPEYAHDYNKLGEISGTYSYDPTHPVISYDPQLLKQPMGFINTLAHELVHAKLEGFQDALPGGADAHELATDLHCILNGFGIFQLQGADDAGWSGYMSQQSRAFAMAIFLAFSTDCTATAEPFLTARTRKYLKRACRDLKSSPEILDLLELDPANL